MKLPPKSPPVYTLTPPQVAVPPVYRPQQGNVPGVQLKPAANSGLETRPAPPVYRPQKNNSVTSPVPATHNAAKHNAAPAAYRPQALQAKPAAPAVYRSQPGGSFVWVGATT